MNKLTCTRVAFAIACLVAAADCQYKVGRFLERPRAELCAERKYHDTFEGKKIYASWLDNETKEEERDWLGVRNWCRNRCMDSISLETPAKNNYVKEKLVKDKIKYIWTSGRLCDFKGCDRSDLSPVHINGWFWSAINLKLAPTTQRNANDWSNTGGINLPQPDNREQFQQNGPPESCLALLNNKYNDGIHWHDVSCHHRKPFMCEDSDELLKWVKHTHPHLQY